MRETVTHAEQADIVRDSYRKSGQLMRTRLHINISAARARTRLPTPSPVAQGPSEMVVRGWDSSMAWRMTNVVRMNYVEARCFHTTGIIDLMWEKCVAVRLTLRYQGKDCKHASGGDTHSRQRNFAIGLHNCEPCRYTKATRAIRTI